MATFVKVDDFVLKLASGDHDFTADVFKLALSNTSPTAATDTQWLTGTHSPPAAANNYTTGGETVTVTGTEASGTLTVGGDEVVYTASGGDIGPFRYAIFYNTTDNDNMICYWDHGSSVTLNTGETYTVTFNSDATDGKIFDIPA